jgi:hypothetical protein
MLSLTTIHLTLLAALAPSVGGAAPFTVTTQDSAAASEAITNGAELLARALAEWELRAATSGEDAEVAEAIEALVGEARAALAAAPNDAAVARDAAAVEVALARFRAERGLERPAAQAQQEPRDARASDEEVIAAAIQRLLSDARSAEQQAAILRFGTRAVPALVAEAPRFRNAPTSGRSRPATCWLRLTG